MTVVMIERTALGIAGVTALGIGAFILVAPHAFYAGYCISLGDDVNLLSELRGPAVGLAASGIVMLTGIWRSGMRQISIVVALTVFLAFPAGRLVGLLADGVPSGSVIGALAIELAIAALCLFAFRHRLGWRVPEGTNSRVAAP